MLRLRDEKDGGASAQGIQKTMVVIVMVDGTSKTNEKKENKGDRVRESYPITLKTIVLSAAGAYYALPLTTSLLYCGGNSVQRERKRMKSFHPLDIPVCCRYATCT